MIASEGWTTSLGQGGAERIAPRRPAYSKCLVLGYMQNGPAVALESGKVEVNWNVETAYRVLFETMLATSAINVQLPAARVRER